MQGAVKARTDVREQLAAYQRDGFVVVHDVVREELLDKLRAIAVTNVEGNRPTFTLLSNRRALSVHDEPVARAIFEEFCDSQHELLVELVGSGALVTDMSVLIAAAGQASQVLHRDSLCLRAEECNVLFPLEPLTMVNGATELVPGSQWGQCNDRYQHTMLELQLRSRRDHKNWCLRHLRLAMRVEGRKRTVRRLATYPFGQTRRWLELRLRERLQPPRVVPDTDVTRFIAAKGDALVYSASLLHRGGANTTTADRYVFGVLLKENRANHRSYVRYYEDEHADFYTANMKDCGTLADYVTGSA